MPADRITRASRLRLTRDAGVGQFRVNPGGAVGPTAAGVNRLHTGRQVGIGPRPG